MPFDSSLPVANSPVRSEELRSQFHGLHTLVQAKAFEEDCVGRLALCAVNPSAVEGMGMVVSDSPTRAEVQAIADKLDELLAVLKR